MSAKSRAMFAAAYPERAEAADPLHERMRRQASRLREKAQGMLAQANELEEMATEAERRR